VSLFAAPTTLTLTDDERAAVLGLTLAPDARGGWQDRLREVQARVKAGGATSTYDDDELLTLQRYAYDYGGGGYQSVFRILLRAAQRAGWVPA
jgi:hypothetical protein